MCFLNKVKPWFDFLLILCFFIKKKTQSYVITLVFGLICCIHTNLGYYWVIYFILISVVIFCSPDPSKIFVKIGLDVHLEMTLPEAADYCEKKVKILTDEAALSTDRSAVIKGKIRFVELALREIHGLDNLKEEQPRKNLFAL